MQRPIAQRQPLCPNWIFTFYTLSCVHCLWLTSGFLQVALPSPGLDIATLFHITAWCFYSMLYMAPVPLISATAVRVLPAGSRWPAVLALLTSILILLALKADHLIYELYSFHVNGFVWNLVTTPGGMESLGSSSSTYWSVTLLVVAHAALQTAALWASRTGLLFCLQHFRAWRWATVAGTLLFMTQGVVYGISDISHHGAVLDSSKAYPLFQRVRFRSLARRLGYEADETTVQSFEQSRTALRYPLAPVQFVHPQKPLNVIIMVVESLRWDQLSADTMPNSWQFARQNLHFTQHYSSGNGTREALFGLFYGLYGSYWEAFLHARQSPLLMDRLQALDYQLDLRTSAAFTYPEFDKTIFTNIPREQLQEAGDELPAWQRDEQNMDALLGFLQTRTSDRPFFSFFFLESTHASYSFPEDRALHQDYTRDVDFTQLHKLDSSVAAAPLLNRYRNAAHWIDAQLGRLYANLESQGLLDSTIVIITGDHGEEFMEKGRWGHNSAFTEEQTHVPMIVHFPGKPAATIDRLTSHLDVAPMLLQVLGLQSAEEEVALGRNLLDDGQRDHVVFSDWHSIGVLTPAFKYRMSYLAAKSESWSPTSAADEAFDAATTKRMLNENRDLILDVMQRFTLFTKRD